MRLVQINAPEGSGQDVMKVAFSSEIKKVSFRKAQHHHADGKVETRDVIDIETSTPKAKHFTDKLLLSDFYDRDKYTIVMREPRSIIGEQDFRELTVPLVEPVTDIF